MAEANRGRKRLVVLAALAGAVIGAGLVIRAVSPPPEPAVEVLVATKDLPVGTVLDEDTIAAAVARKAVSRGELPVKYLATEDALRGKRVARPMRAGDVFHPDDAVSGGVVTIPAGFRMVTAQIDLPFAVQEMLSPGSKVDVSAAVCRNGKVVMVTILRNVTVLAMDCGAGGACGGLSFAVDRKQALVVELAKMNGGPLSVLPVCRGHWPQPKYDIDQVVAFFARLDAVRPLEETPELPKWSQTMAIEFAPPTNGWYCGFGARIDVLATARFGDRTRAFPAAVNVFVIGVDQRTGPNGQLMLPLVTCAVTDEQAALLALARSKACSLAMVPRSPDDPSNDCDIEYVVASLNTLPPPAPQVK